LATIRSTSDAGPRIPRPKILLVDLPKECDERLRDEGYNASAGTFGRPWAITNQDAYYYVALESAALPNFEEQEVIVADLARPDLGQNPAGDPPASGTRTIYARGVEGLVDPRPRVMREVTSAFDRALEHGGALVVFADAPQSGNYALGEQRHAGGNFWPSETVEMNNWGLQANVAGMIVSYAEGDEIVASDAAKQLGLKTVLEASTYTCTFEPDYRDSERWYSLAKNKYDADVAGILLDTDGKVGPVLVLPRVPDQALVVRDLVTDLLPRLAPRVFPDAEDAGWAHATAYELPEVATLRAQIEEERARADERVSELQEQIDAKRDDFGYLHELLIQQDDRLVQAVIQALETLGFEKVVDADKEAEERGDRGDRREDLQILDDSPSILAEVKGIAGQPSEENSLQVTKYLAPRMKEWGRTDIRGLTIINHQRNLPPLDRDNTGAFQQDVLTGADHQDLTLVTAFDLYRLVRGHLENGWAPAAVKPLFYENGRIDPVPKHYEYLGKIVNFWEQAAALGVVLGDNAPTVRVGDTLGFEQPTTFVEEQTTSLQVGDKAVEEAGPGSDLGVTTALSKAQLRPGTRVFRVGTPASDTQSCPPSSPGAVSSKERPRNLRPPRRDEESRSLERRGCSPTAKLWESSATRSLTSPFVLPRSSTR